MKYDVEKKELEETEIDATVKLHNRFIGDNRTEAQLKHEYFGFSREKATFTILKDGDKVIGSQGYIPHFLVINNNDVLTSKSENSLLDPKYRGGTLFQDLYEYGVNLSKEKGVNLIWGLTLLARVWREKLMFKVYEGVMYQIISIANLKSSFRTSTKLLRNRVKNRFKRISLSLILPVVLICFKTFAILRKLFQNILLKFNKFDYNLNDELSNEKDIIQLYERLSSKIKNLIYIKQDKKFLSWRIYENPKFKYKTCFAYRNDCLKGYFYITTDTDLKIGYITDFTFEDIEAGKYLLKEMLSFFKKDKVSFIHSFGNDTNVICQDVHNLLKKYGFIKIKSKMSFVIKNLNHEEKEIVDDISNWYITNLWTELYNS